MEGVVFKVCLKGQLSRLFSNLFDNVLNNNLNRTFWHVLSLWVVNVFSNHLGDVLQLNQPSTRLTSQNVFGNRFQGGGGCGIGEPPCISECDHQSLRSTLRRNHACSSQGSRKGRSLWIFSVWFKPLKLLIV
jgi:hypothetical protein